MRTYTEFFGFLQEPFKRTSDIGTFYITKEHEDTLENLNYLLFSNETFAVIIGEPGTGKTLTMKKFVSDLPENVVSSYTLLPNIPTEELFKSMLDDFNVPYEIDSSKSELETKIKNFIALLDKEDKRALVIIDEAQNLSNQTLLDLSSLSNHETEDKKLLKIVLLGNKELETKLNNESLSKIKEKVKLYNELNNLEPEKVKEYINYHIEKAGRGRIKISNSVINKISDYTKGNPKLINMLMEKTIIVAYLENSYTIYERHLITAISSLNNVVGSSDFIKVKKRKGNKFLTSAIVLLVSGIALYFALDKYYLQPRNIDISSITIASIENTINDFLANKNKEKAGIKEETIDTIKVAQNNTKEEIVEQENIIKQNQKDKVVSNNNANIEKEEKDKEEKEKIEVAVNNVQETETVNSTNYNKQETQNPDTENSNINITENILVEKNSTSDIEKNKDKEEIVEKQSEKFVVIKVNILNIRSAPDLTGVKVGTAKKGNEYKLISSKDEWVEIMINNNLTGWVYRMYVDVVDKPIQ